MEEAAEEVSGMIKNLYANNRISEMKALQSIYTYLRSETRKDYEEEEYNIEEFIDAVQQRTSSSGSDSSFGEE